ncbi:MAG: hypothetical protein P8Y97_18105 [Candidatus Lokiarchaeota archaeon]
MKPKKPNNQKSKTLNKRKESIDDHLKKLEIIEQMENLKREAQTFKLNNEYDKAIILADKIMRIAVNKNLPDYMEEQVKFIKSISQNVQKNYLTSQIKAYAIWILKQYDKLIESEAYYQAHEIVERFKESYENLDYFEDIPEVKEVIGIDRKEWLKFSLKTNKL